MKSKYTKYDDIGVIKNMIEYENGWYQARYSFGYKFEDRVCVDLMYDEGMKINWYDLTAQKWITKEEARLILKICKTDLYKAVYNV